MYSVLALQEPIQVVRLSQHAAWLYPSVLAQAKGKEIWLRAQRFFPYSLQAGEAEFQCAWVVVEEHLPGSHPSARFCADRVILNTFLVRIQEASVMIPQKTDFAILIYAVLRDNLLS